MDKENLLEATDTGTKVCQEGMKSVIINLSKANVINHNPLEQQQPEDIPIKHNSWSPIAKGLRIWLGSVGYSHSPCSFPYIYVDSSFVSFVAARCRRQYT